MLVIYSLFIILTNKCTTHIHEQYFVTTPTCFDVSASSSGCPNPVLAEVIKPLKLLKLQLNKSIGSSSYDKIYKMLIKQSCCLVAVYTIWTVLCWCFLYAGRSTHHTSIQEDDADVSKHVVVLTKYCWCICIAHLLGWVIKCTKMHGTYIKILLSVITYYIYIFYHLLCFSVVVYYSLICMIRQYSEYCHCTTAWFWHWICEADWLNCSTVAVLNMRDCCLCFICLCVGFLYLFLLCDGGCNIVSWLHEDILVCERQAHGIPMPDVNAAAVLLLEYLHNWSVN